MPCLRPPEPPTTRVEDIKMELDSKDGTISGTITKALDLSFPGFQNLNWYCFATIPRPT